MKPYVRVGRFALLAASLLTLPVGPVTAQTSAAGIGVQIAADTNGAKVTVVTPGGPAERAGVRVGDVITDVDGVALVRNVVPRPKVDITVVTNRIRGAQGTSVRLTLLSPNGQRRQVQIVRAPIVIPAAAAAPPPAPPASGGAGGLTFVKWSEPQEHSFTTEVPAGWQVEGGVHWLGQIDPEGYVRAKSPDGKLQVFMGDPDLLARQVPSAISRMQTGVSEGQTFQTPAGGPALLQRYMTGVQYAKTHVTWRLCKTPAWVAQDARPDMSRALAAAIDPEARRYNMTVSVDAGESTFTCGAIQGAVFAATVLASSRSGPIQVWTVYRVAGFQSADPMRSMQARYVMEHMLATVTPDPVWTANLERRTMQVTGSVISMQNAATQAQLAASRQQNETLARLNHPNTFSPSSAASGRSSSSVNTTLGTKQVCDAIGRCGTVSTDHTNYWVDHSGNITPGPESGGPPDNSGVWSPAFGK